MDVAISTYIIATLVECEALVHLRLPKIIGTNTPIELPKEFVSFVRLLTMGKGLKAALKLQQSRLKAKEKARIAVHTAVLKGKRAFSRTESVAPTPRSKGKEKQSLANQRPTIPFQPADKILLIGEGNFSFARALALVPPSVLDSLPPRNITATTYDTEQECYRKYHDAEEIVEMLRHRGVEVLFGVDATKLEKIQRFKGRKWDRIVWNFPHIGVYQAAPLYQNSPHILLEGKGITDKDRNILSNQILILDFLRSASGFLKSGPVPLIHQKKRKNDEGDEEDDIVSDDSGGPSYSANSQIAVRGTILITLRNVSPYTLW